MQYDDAVYIEVGVVVIPSEHSSLLNCSHSFYIASFNHGLLKNPRNSRHSGYSVDHYRKEFMIPSDVVRETGKYSLKVLTESQPSYSNVFSIETAARGSATGKGGVVNAAAGANSVRVGDRYIGTQECCRYSIIYIYISSLKDVELTATASAVALAVVFVAAHFCNSNFVINFFFFLNSGLCS